MAPSLGTTDFRFETPSVGSRIDQYHRVILTRGSCNREARAYKGLLLPGGVLPYVHRRTASKIDRKSEDRINQAGAVDLAWSAVHISAEVSNDIGQGGRDVRRSAPRTECMKVTEGFNIEFAAGISDGERWVKENPANVKGVGHYDSVRVDWGDNVCAWIEILRLTSIGRTAQRDEQNGSAQTRWIGHSRQGKEYRVFRICAFAAPSAPGWS